jgi:hypothetical protein
VLAIASARMVCLTKIPRSFSRWVLAASRGRAR